MSYAEWFRRYFTLPIPKRRRQCLFGGPFPCNAGCAFNHPRGCAQADKVRAEEAG